MILTIKHKNLTRLCPRFNTEKTNIGVKSKKNRILQNLKFKRLKKVCEIGHIENQKDKIPQKKCVFIWRFLFELYFLEQVFRNWWHFRIPPDLVVPAVYSWWLSRRPQTCRSSTRNSGRSRRFCWNSRTAPGSGCSWSHSTDSSPGLRSPTPGPRPGRAPTGSSVRVDNQIDTLL